MSTRGGPKGRYRFEKGEKVLCYEPDPTKAKVLYNSKILGIYETKDKRGLKLVQYKVHFQGWSSTWDRKVNADFLLKDSEQNRQLQRDLAEKAQLQIGAYLYRKDRGGSNSSKKSSQSELAVGGGSGGDNIPSPKIRARGSSEENFSSGSTFERHEDFSMKDDGDSESYCSSVEESIHDDERVMLRISERLRQYLEYDRDMVVKYDKQHALPARVPVIDILENFVKQSAVKLVVSTTQTENTRRRTTQQRTDKKEREFDKLVSTVGLLKEVADGLRIYFDFTLVDYLLYKEERDYALWYLSEENLKNFTYVASPGLYLDFLNPKSSDSSTALQTMESVIEAHATNEEPQKRKLRSHRSGDDYDLVLENCLSSIASTSSGASTPLQPNISHSSTNYLRSLQPMAHIIPPPTKEFLQSLLSWRLLPSNAAPAASMIFGAPHLARLIIKLPEFLNASAMSDEKLKILLQHLDSFINFLEAREDWFNEENYARSNKSANMGENANPLDAEAQQAQQQQQEESKDQAEGNTGTTATKTSTSIVT